MEIVSGLTNRRSVTGRELTIRVTDQELLIV